MSANTLEAYRHSGKFNVSAVALVLGASAVFGFPLGLAYAHFVRWVPFVYLNMLATVAYGFFFGWLATKALKLGHVRNTTVATGCGVAAGLIALYFDWSGFIHAAWEDGLWFSPPREILAAMAYLYEHGSWGMKSGDNITGIFLALIWAAEAGIVLFFATTMARGFVQDTPYCEKTRCWLDEEKKINTLESITDAAQLTALRAGDIMPIVAAKPRAETAAVFTRLLLKRSPKCQVFCTLRVQDISLSVDGKGNVTEKAINLTGDLIIPASMFDLIAKFEDFKPVPVVPA